MRDDAFDTINELLVHLFHEILELEEQAIITEEYKDISNNDMHIIEAIGLGENSTMSMVAKKLRITAGSLTTSINSLVRKNYVIRKRSEKDRRVVYIILTEKGCRAYQHHKQFHIHMVNAAIEKMDEEELSVLVSTLNKLTAFFKKYQENPQD